MLLGAYATCQYQNLPMFKKRATCPLTAFSPTDVIIRLLDVIIRMNKGEPSFYDERCGYLLVIFKVTSLDSLQNVG